MLQLELSAAVITTASHQRLGLLAPSVLRAALLQREQALLVRLRLSGNRVPLGHLRNHREGSVPLDPRQLPLPLPLDRPLPLGRPNLLSGRRHSVRLAYRMLWAVQTDILAQGPLHQPLHLLERLQRLQQVLSCPLRHPLPPSANLPPLLQHLLSGNPQFQLQPQLSVRLLLPQLSDGLLRPQRLARLQLSVSRRQPQLSVSLQRRLRRLATRRRLLPPLLLDRLALLEVVLQLLQNRRSGNQAEGLHLLVLLQLLRIPLFKPPAHRQHQVSSLTLRKSSPDTD